MPKDFTLVNSCSPGAKKFTERWFHTGRFQSGRTMGPHARHKTRATGCSWLWLRVSSPGRCPGPQSHSVNLRVKSNSGSRNENRAVHFCPRPEASKKKKKSVIPEQIPFLPGLSAPSHSLPTTTVPPLFQCPTSLHIIKKKKVANSLFLSFPHQGLETGGNSNQITAH